MCYAPLYLFTSVVLLLLLIDSNTGVCAQNKRCDYAGRSKNVSRENALIIVKCDGKTFRRLRTKCRTRKRSSRSRGMTVF